MDFKNIDIKSGLNQLNNGFNKGLIQLNNGFNELKKAGIERAGKYGPRIVNQINALSQHLQNDSRLAFATVLVANTVFFEIAKILSKWIVPIPKDTNTQKHPKRNFARLTVKILILTGMNVSLCKMVNLPLKNVVTTAAIIGGVLFNIFINIALQKKASSDKEKVRFKA